MDSPNEGQQRTTSTTFVMKTYRLVDNPSNNDVISWIDGDDAFLVSRSGVFAHVLLSQQFKHNNLSSFVRHLKLYRFKKISVDRWDYTHGFFHRGEEQLLYRVKRQKISQPPVQPVAAKNGDKQTSAVGLRAENKWLHKENTRLSSEVAQLKGICDNILLQISDCQTG